MIYFHKEQIPDIIPQRDPIIMIDSATIFDSVSLQTTLTIHDKNWFVNNGIFLEAGLMEHAAQSAAALIGVEAIMKNEKPKIGLIGEIKNFETFRLAKINETLTTDLSVLTTIENVTIVETKTKINEELITTGRIMVFLTQQ